MLFRSKCNGIILPSINGTVYSEGIPVVVLGDKYNPHPGVCSHNTMLVPLSCSPNVFINNFNVGVEGGLLACNDVTMLNPTNEINTNVFVNNPG